MMFSKDDFRVESASDLLHFLPILAIVALVAPFLIGAYTLGFVMDKTGWLATD